MQYEQNFKSIFTTKFWVVHSSLHMSFLFCLFCFSSSFILPSVLWEAFKKGYLFPIIMDLNSKSVTMQSYPLASPCSCCTFIINHCTYNVRSVCDKIWSQNLKSSYLVKFWRLHWLLTNYSFVFNMSNMFWQVFNFFYFKFWHQINLSHTPKHNFYHQN